MNGPQYVPPTVEDGEEVVDLMRSSTRGPVKEPAPNERVLAINRGRRVLHETFDAHHFEIPASSKFYIEYGAARHAQARQIVPGTRNATDGSYRSFIGIIGVDPPELCEPFTNEELAKMGEAVEAIDRSQDHGFGKEVKVLPTAIAQAASPSLGVGRGQAGIDASVQASDAASAAAESVLDTPLESATRADAAEAAGGRAPRTPRGRR